MAIHAHSLSFVASFALVAAAVLPAARSAAASPGDVNWDDRFGHPGVQNGVFGTSVNAVAVNGTDIYVGGSFGEAGDVAHSRALRWDGRAWNELGGGVDGNVGAVAVDPADGSVYVGGDFVHVRNGTTSLTVNGIARWDGTSWSALGGGVAWSPSCDICIDPVRVEAIDIVGSSVYVGGSFDLAGGVTGTAGIARWDGTNWNAVGGGVLYCDICSPPISGEVRALQIVGQRLYVGGRFTKAGPADALGVAWWDTTATGPSGWHAMDSGVADGDGYVNAFALNGSTLFVGGAFGTVGTAGTPVNSLATWDGSAWHTVNGDSSGVCTATACLSPAWNFSYGTVNALLVQSGVLYVGGDFAYTEPGSLATAGGLATFAISTKAWSNVPFDSPLGVVTSMARNPLGGIVVGGSYVMGGPLLIDAVGVLNGTTWQPLGQGFSSSDEFGASEIDAVGDNGAQVYAGGWFAQAGGTVTSGIARWDGAAWHALGPGRGVLDAHDGGVRNGLGIVRAIYVNGAQVFIGGSFTSVNGVPAANIAVWNGTSWRAVAGGTNGAVQALRAYNGYLYVGGSFTRAGGKTGGPFARWKLGTALTNTAGWSTMPLPPGVAGGIDAIAVAAGKVLIGGDLARCASNSPCANPPGTDHSKVCENASGWDVNGLLAWNPTRLGFVSMPGCGVVYANATVKQPGVVNALLAIGTSVYLGGLFDRAGITGKSANSVAAMNIAQLDLSGAQPTWRALGAGAGNDMNLEAVNDIDVLGPSLYVAGNFAKAGALAAAPGVARWSTASKAWAALGSGLACGGMTANCGLGVSATAIDVTRTGVFVGGTISAAGGKPAMSFARWGVPPAANAVANPGFEQATGGVPNTWTLTSSSSASTLTWSTTFAHTGTHSLKIVSTGTDTTSATQSVTGIAPAKQYVYSGWVKVPYTTDGYTMTADVQWLNSSASVLRTDVVKVYHGSVGGWDQFMGIKQPPAGAATGLVRVRVQNTTSGQSASIYLDDVALGPVP